MNLSKLTDAQLALLGKQDLFFLLKWILGYKDYQHEVHRNMCDEFMNLKNDKWLLTLWPRGTFKSTTGVIGYPLWIMANDACNPGSFYGDTRVLIVCHSEKKAKGYLTEIKGHIENENSLYRRLYRGVNGQALNDVPKSWEWSATAISGSHRKRSRKEPSIMICGIDNIPTGYHFDRIIVDDPVDPEGVDSETERRRIKRRFRDLEPLMDPGGAGCVIGTRWHQGDLYGWIKAEKKKMDFEVLEKKAWEMKNGKRVLNFPTILSYEKLMIKKARIGQRLFACNYLNDPMQDESRPFTTINWRKPSELPKDTYEFAILCDANDSLGDRADYTAILTVAHAVHYHQIWVARAFVKRCLAANVPRIMHEAAKQCEQEFMPRLTFNGHDKPYFKGIVCEKYAFQTMILSALQKYMLEQNRIYPLVPLPRDTVKSKDARIMGLTPRQEAGGILWNSDEQGSEMMHLATDQFLQYPSGHDDVPDALAQANQVFSFVGNPEQIVMAEPQSETIQEKRERVARERVAADHKKAFGGYRSEEAVQQWLTDYDDDDW